MILPNEPTEVKKVNDNEYLEALHGYLYYLLEAEYDMIPNRTELHHLMSLVKEDMNEAIAERINGYIAYREEE